MLNRLARLSSALAAALLLLAGCSDDAPKAPPKPPGLKTDPERLAFLCVAPGCDATQTLHVTVIGERRVAIKRVLLSGDQNGDFSITPSEQPPFVVGSNSGFHVDVRYAPTGAPAAGNVELLITYTDASPDESADRLEAGELRVQLVRRVVGEPRLKVATKTLKFGVVTAGEARTLPLGITNEGFGNVALELASVTADHADVVPGAPEVKGLPPGASTELPVTFSPKTEGFISATLTLKATSPDVPVETVRVEGTSLAVPRIAIEPQGDIDFGEVPKGKKREVKAFLLNQGGTPLSIDALTVTDSTGNLKARLPSETLPLSVAPLERVPLTLTLDGITPAELDARVTVASNDPATPSLQVKVFGTVTEPKATVTPVKIDFGNVPVGWVLRRAVEVRNTGFGPLKVKNVTLVSGSSNLFTLQQLPAFPLTLKREQRMAVEVEFRAETQATFNGWVSVETDDPVNPFQEVPLSAVSGSCASSCPIANGTPSCSKGVCEVGTCNANWYDVDKSASNGCECKEPNSDPGSFCADSIYKGVLKDNDKAQVNHLGIIHSEEDVDVIRFFAEDAFSLFSDNFDVKVRLVSNDPNIRMCVYRNPTGSHTSECYWTNEFCPADRYFRKDSSGSGGDDADFIVKVFRAPGSKGSCTTYTVYMSNGI